MSTYTYSCNQCGQFDVEQSVKDEPLEVCSNYKEPVKRVFKPVGVGVTFPGKL